jgi:hypothetical protein
VEVPLLDSVCQFSVDEQSLTQSARRAVEERFAGRYVSKRTKCSKPPVDIELSSSEELQSCRVAESRTAGNLPLFVAETPVIFGQWAILDRSTLSVTWCVEAQQYGKLDVD